MERNRCYFCKLPTMMAASSRPVVFSPHFPSSFFLNVSLEVMLQPPARYSAAFAWHPENIISLDFYNSPAIERFFPYSILHTPPGISPSPRCHYFYFMFFPFSCCCLCRCCWRRSVQNYFAICFA